MAKRSNRRRESLQHPGAFEADSPISPRRADAHHGQESQNSTNRSDIRPQSYLGANDLPHAHPWGEQLAHQENLPECSSQLPWDAVCAKLSTAARPPASQRGALSAGRPWITSRPSPPYCISPICTCTVGGVHIRTMATTSNAATRKKAPFHVALFRKQTTRARSPGSAPASVPPRPGSSHGAGRNPRPGRGRSWRRRSSAPPGG